MEVKLGFGSIPKPQYVFISRENDYCWYMLTEDKKHIPIYERALTGVITGIEIQKTIETSFGEVKSAVRNRIYTNKTHLRGFQTLNFTLVRAGGLSVCSQASAPLRVSRLKATSARIEFAQA